METRRKRLNTEVDKGKVIEVEGQTFVGYTTTPKTMEEVNLAYAKIKGLHTEARHIVSACRLPGRNFHINQDYYDDDEHNGGSYLLKLLVSCEIQNHAVFVVRNYDGEHIGQRRYQAMFDVVASAVESNPVNVVTGTTDKIWSVESKSTDYQADKPRYADVIRGRGGGRGKGRLRRTPIWPMLKLNARETEDSEEMIESY